ncbi:fibrinogen-like protein 1 [Palaemon carinicauda]|uniref:fibrinogen-like protein 1 n=1 Tax=Palaemon carinicauda TaxID=392227 RepID=UPI0035B6A635
MSPPFVRVLFCGILFSTCCGQQVGNFPYLMIENLIQNHQSLLKILEETRAEVKIIKDALLQRNVLPLEERIEENKVLLQGVKENVASLQEGCLAQVERNHKVIEDYMNNDSKTLERTLEAYNETLNEIMVRSKSTSGIRPRDCSGVLKSGETENGIYQIFPVGIPNGVDAYCDLQTDGGGWTVIIQRQEEIPPLNFARTFEEYATGFGRPDGEFWIGNRILHALSGNKPQTLLVEARSLGGVSREARWTSFSVGSEETEFTLSVAGYLSNSTMGDGLTPHFSARHNANGMKFSTIDRKNKNKCSDLGGGGWWFNHCYGVNPTAPRGVEGNIRTLNYFFWSLNEEKEYTGLSSIRFKIRPRDD